MRYTIIGGVNGAGKSTIYVSQLDADVKALGKRINVDEIVSIYGDWRDTNIQFRAGKKAVAKIKTCYAKLKLPQHNPYLWQRLPLCKVIKITRINN